MNSAKQHKLIKEIADYFGVEDRRIKAMEELGEAIAALARKDNRQIAEEFADSLILMQELIYLLGIEKNVESWTEIKLERVMDLHVKT